MSRLKGCVAAGLRIWITKPAQLTKHDRYSCLLLAGIVASLMGVSSLVGVSGSSIPVPPRKPDTVALIQSGMINASYAPSAEPSSFTEETYRSPLAGPQMDLYRDIFRMQAAGSFAEADALIAKLKDKSLMGHVLAQRYLHANYKADFTELADWLSNYADHPQAERIARLAGARAPSGTGHPFFSTT